MRMEESGGTSSTYKIEEILIGSFLLTEQNYWPVSERLKPEYFSDAFFRRVYEEIQSFAADLRAMTWQAIEFKVAGVDAGSAGPGARLSIAMQAADAHEGTIPKDDYVTLLEDAYVRRSAGAILDKAKSQCFDESKEATQTIESAIEALTVLQGTQTSRFVSYLGDVASDVVDQAGSPGTMSLGIDCMIPEITDMTGKWMPGDVVLLGGESGSGKTALAAQIAYLVSFSHAIDFFELEMPSQRIGARLLSREANLEAWKILEGRIKEGEYAGLVDLKDKMRRSRLRLIEQPAISVAQMRARSLARKKTDGLDMMVADHIKLVGAVNQRFPGKLHDRVYENTGLLKAVAKELQCVVLVVCQYVKEDAGFQKVAKPEPTKNNFYGGNIAEHADIMLATLNRYKWMMDNQPAGDERRAKWRDDASYHKGRIEIFKLKDRNRENEGRRFLKWTPRTTSFSSLEDAPSSTPDLIPVV